MPAVVSERRVVTLVALNMFVILVNFVMVFVLGPDIAGSLHFPGSDLGLVNGAYAGAATVSCLVGAFYFDRFGRRSLLVVLMLGLDCGIFATSLAPGRTSLLAARTLCGVFGVAAGSTALAIIADTVPAERRGRATSAVLSAASLVTVFGDPAALELSRRYGWRTVFGVTAVLCLLTALGTLALLPPLRDHLDEPAGPRIPVLRPTIRWAYLASLLVLVPTFLIGPNMTTYLLWNLGYPRKGLALLFLASGIAGFIAQRAAGRFIDRFGAVRVDALNTLFYCVVVLAGLAVPLLSAAALAILYEMTVLTRQLPYQTLASMVPAPAERGRFNSLRSALHQAGATTGAVLGARLLRTLPDQKLDRVPRVAVAAMVTAAALPFFLHRIARLLARERASSVAGLVKQSAPT
jgi:predicted MFS family arabinose efflux permease